MKRRFTFLTKTGLKRYIKKYYEGEEHVDLDYLHYLTETLKRKSWFEVKFLGKKFYDIYYASGWFSPEQEKNYKEITTKLKSYRTAFGEELTIFEPRYEAGELNQGPITLEKAKQIFNDDLKGIHSCTMVFSDISFRDTGVLFELGYAQAKGKPVTLFDNSEREKMNIMLAGGAKDCMRNLNEVQDWLNGEFVKSLDKEFE